MARGVATAQAVAAAEQIQIQVPNEKVSSISDILVAFLSTMFR